MNQQQWQSLSPGDKISVIAPGMPFDRNSFLDSEKIIKSWGLELTYPKDILGGHPICASSVEKRISFFQKALSSSSPVIWAARGGYGSLHLISALQRMKKPTKPKLLLGFSDITTLHQFVNQEWNWPSIHGSHVDRLSFLKPNLLKNLKNILFGKTSEIIFKNLKPLNKIAAKNQQISSEIVGGNLIVLQSTLGTRWQIPAAKKILFLEELGERAYKVDRVLTHFELLGVFKNVKALVLGPFVGGNEPDGSNKIKITLKNFAEQQKFPVFTGIKVGHIPDSQLLPFNTRATLRVLDGRGTLNVSTGVKL